MILGIDVGTYQTIIANIGTMGSLEHRRLLSCVAFYPNAKKELLDYTSNVSRSLNEQRVQQIYFPEEYLQEQRDMWIYGSTALEVCEELDKVIWPFQDCSPDKVHLYHKAGVSFFKKIYCLAKAKPKVYLALPPGTSAELRVRIVNMARDAGAADVVVYPSVSLASHWIMNTRKINRIITIDIGSQATDFCIAPNIVNTLASGYCFSIPQGWQQIVDKLLEKIKEEGYIVREEKVIQWFCQNASFEDEFAEANFGACETTDGKFCGQCELEIGEFLCEIGDAWLAEIIEQLIININQCGRKGIIRGEDRDIFLKRIFVTGGGAKIEGLPGILKDYATQKLELSPGIVIVQSLGKINDFLAAMAGFTLWRRTILRKFNIIGE